MLGKKRFALLCAIIHYGLGNMSTDSKPPNINTVVDAAKKFEEFITDDN